MSYLRRIGKMKPRKKKKREHPEDDFQKTVCDVVKMHGFHGWHTPNGGRRWKAEAMRFVGMGVLPGVSDYFIMEPWEWNFDPEKILEKFKRGWIWRPPERVKGMIICLELKVWPNTLTDAQKEFMRESSERGALCGVAYDIDEALAALRCVRPLNGRRLT